MFTIEKIGSGDYSFTFDRDDIPYHMGACDADISEFREANQSEIEKVTIEDCIDILACTGGWDRDELADWEVDELYEAVLWVAAGDAYDMDDQDGDTIESYLSTY